MERKQQIPCRDWQQLFLALSTGTGHWGMWRWDPLHPCKQHPHLPLSANTVRVPWATLTDALRALGQPEAPGERTGPCWVGTEQWQQPQQHSGSSGTRQAQRGWGDAVLCDRELCSSAITPSHGAGKSQEDSAWQPGWPHQPAPTSGGSFRQAASIKGGSWDQVLFRNI